MLKKIILVFHLVIITQTYSFYTELNIPPQSQLHYNSNSPENFINLNNYITQPAESVREYTKTLSELTSLPCLGIASLIDHSWCIAAEHVLEGNQYIHRNVKKITTQDGPLIYGVASIGLVDTIYEIPGFDLALCHFSRPILSYNRHTAQG